MERAAADTAGRCDAAVTHLSLKNPLASLMLSIAVLVFACVVTPRMTVDTFPDLTPPVLVVGTLAPGLAADCAVAWATTMVVFVCAVATPLEVFR